MTVKLIIGDIRKAYKFLDNNSIDCIITSPPYWRQRDYGVDEQIGQEEKPEQYASEIANVFSLLWDKLKKTATVFLNIGYKYYCEEFLLIPEMVAFEMKKRGYMLKNKIIWCVAEDTKMFVLRNGNYLHIPIKKVKAGDFVLTLDKEGKFRWVRVKNVFNNGFASVLKITTKSGREIVCTEEHQFPVKSSYHYGKYLKLRFKKAKDLTTKDFLWVNSYCPRLITTTSNSDDFRKGFIIGFFLAEGSYIKGKRGIYKDNTLSKAAQKRWGRLNNPKTVYYGIQLACGEKDLELGYIDYFKQFKITIKKYMRSIHVYSRDKNLLSLIKKYVYGEGCNKKHLKQSIWNESPEFIRGVVQGFLAGDGYYEEKSNRWRVKIKPNQDLLDDLILACRIIGYDFRYEGISNTNYGTKAMTFTIKPEVRRRYNSGYLYSDRVDKIQKIGIKRVYDIEVEPIYTSYCGRGKSNKPSKEINKNKWNNLYFLANGIWTHNSKPNAMPTPARNRLNNTYEVILFFVKNIGREVYYFNLEALADLFTQVDDNSLKLEDLLLARVEDSISSREGRTGIVKAVNSKAIKVCWNDGSEQIFEFAWEQKEAIFRCVLCNEKLNFWDIMLQYANYEKFSCRYCGCEKLPIPELPTVLLPADSWIYVQKSELIYKDRITNAKESKKYKKAGILTSSPAGRLALTGEKIVIKRKWIFPQPLIADYLKEKIKEKGLTVNQLEKLMGYEYTAAHWLRKDFSYWGKGGSLPRPTDWLKLKTMLGLDNTYDRLICDLVAMISTIRRHPKGKNIGDVWEIATEPYEGEHFSVFPKRLVERCIKIGCPPGGVVLDPFAGSGTVGEVAKKLGRHAILVEINPEYKKLIERRCGKVETIEGN
jgi:DNA modification methylase